METKDIISLGKSLEQRKELDKEIGEKKLEKSRLDKNVTILKRVEAEEQTEHNKNKLKRKEDKTKIEESIEKLETQRANLANTTIPEIKKLNALRKEVGEKQAKLDKDQISIDAKSDRVAKDQAKVESKIEAIKQIKELCGKI